MNKSEETNGNISCVIFLSVLTIFNIRYCEKSFCRKNVFFRKFIGKVFKIKVIYITDNRYVAMSLCLDYPRLETYC